jgi:hypothetical protein
MRVSWEPSSNMTASREVQPAKQYLQRNTTENGIVIDFNDEQFQNADSEIDWSLESDSNVTFEIDVQNERQDLPRISRERGFEIDFNDEQPSNDDSPIWFNELSDSNLITSRNSQPRKQCEQSCRIDRPISTSRSFPNDRIKHVPSIDETSWWLFFSRHNKLNPVGFVFVRIPCRSPDHALSSLDPESAPRC